jgi:anti-anti-sigma factor
VSNFSVSLRTADDVVIILPSGYMDDIGAERIEETSAEILRRGAKKLVVNFSDTQLINSIGVSILSSVIQKARESDITLCFTNVKKVHRDVFDLLGITKHVRMFGEEGEAISFLCERG